MVAWVVPNIQSNKTLDYCVREWVAKHKYILNLCDSHNTVVQAGGNIGIFPNFLSKYFKTVITYEPIYKNYEALKLNTTLHDNIISYNKGLGNKDGFAAIKQEDILNSGAIQLEYTLDESNISVVRFDSENISELDLLWLDVEGFEVKAIKGALNTIDKYKPVLVVENNGLMPEYPGTLQGSNEFRKWVESLGYKHIHRIMRDDIFIPA